MVFGPDGTAYSAGYSDTWLYTINTQTGVGTKNHNTGYHGFGDLAFNGGNLFMCTDTYDLVKIDLAGHGSAQQVMPLGMTTLWNRHGWGWLPLRGCGHIGLQIRSDGTHTD